jgi:hypothetical protein
VAFLSIASPLLFYNWRVFGSPFFNYNTAHVIWLDYTEEQMIMFDKGLPTLSSYFATHSLAEIFRRGLRGLVLVRGVEWVWPFLLLFLLLPKRRLAYFYAFPSKAAMMTVASTLVLTFYLAFAWSAVVQRGIRYLLPIFPVIFLLMADIAVFYAARLAHWLYSPPIWERLASPALAGVPAVLGAVWCTQLATRDLPSPLAIDFEDQETAALYQLLDTPAFDGKQVLFGPSHDFTGTWLFRHNVAFPIIPPGLPAAEFVPWLEERGIDYILASKDMIRRRADTIGMYVAYSPPEGVQVLRLEPEWEVVYRGSPPTRFILIRLR